MMFPTFSPDYEPGMAADPFDPGSDPDYHPDMVREPYNSDSDYHPDMVRDPYRPGPDYHPDMVPDPLEIDIRQMDIHALDIEDLPVDARHDVINDLINVPANSSIENFTYVPYNATWVFGRAEDRYILPIILTVIGICALISNGLIIFAIIRRRRMRTGANLMFLNISMADLVFMVFCIPSAIVNHACGVGAGILTDNWCKFIHYVLFVTVYVGIYTLVIICVFRLCSEMLQTKLGSLLSRGNALVSSFVIWVAFLISHVNLLVQEESPIFQEPFICMHVEVIADQSKMRTLWVTFLTCAFLLPLLTICSLSAVSLHNLNYSNDRESDPLETKTKREFTMVTMTTMVVRTVCWLPIQIFVMIDVFGMADFTTMYRKAEMIGVCCAFMSACVNVLIYNCLSAEFRLAFRDSGKTFVHKASRTPDVISSRTGRKDEHSEMNETILSILTDSSNHINYS